MQRLGMPVSDDTILRQLKRDAACPIRVVGIDDWSWRRSWRYGTIFVDLERRSVVDILEDRSASSTAQWLKQHPSVEIVSRDRCGLYAQAAREGAPQAHQVVDRFHLMQNLRLAIEEQMSLAGRATGRALLLMTLLGLRRPIKFRMIRSLTQSIGATCAALTGTHDRWYSKLFMP
jgi:transposase